MSRKWTVFWSKSSKKGDYQKSLENYGYILVAPDLDTAIETANPIASEHLEIVTANPFEVMSKIKNAGAIFIGEYSCEPLGDYFAGPNHILPTNGTAKFFSPQRRRFCEEIQRHLLLLGSSGSRFTRTLKQFAACEQLTAHANSIAVRFEEQES
ncbi:MAG: histidinol dehydrogenase [Eubacterium sp.]